LVAIVVDKIRYCSQYCNSFFASYWYCNIFGLMASTT